MRRSKVVLTLDEIKQQQGEKAFKKAQAEQQEAQKLYDSKRFLDGSIQTKIQAGHK